EWTVLWKDETSFDSFIGSCFCTTVIHPLIDGPPYEKTVRPSFHPLALKFFSHVIRLWNYGLSLRKKVRPFHHRFPTTWKWFLDHTALVELLEVWTILLRDGPSFALFVGRL
ncbi:hypothetical protein HAX54_028094, partial [Datura stramonium]|nr:hypothetical protein [Datura stramonium]